MRKSKRRMAYQSTTDESLLDRWEKQAAASGLFTKEEVAATTKAIRENPFVCVTTANEPKGE